MGMERGIMPGETQQKVLFYSFHARFGIFGLVFPKKLLRGPQGPTFFLSKSQIEMQKIMLM